MKFVALCIAILLLFGCATMKETEWYAHDAQWASWDHMLFSISGYKEPDIGDLVVSGSEKWWGTPHAVKTWKR